MKNDVNGARQVSTKVNQALETIIEKMCSNGASCLFQGGDSLIFGAPEELPISSVPLEVEGVQFSIGLGQTIQDASIALFKAKAMGRNRLERGLL